MAQATEVREAAPMAQVQGSEWTMRAHCRDRGDDMFGESQDQKRARAVCTGCPVRLQCLAEALTHRIEWGVWGGMTERERRHLLRQRPDIQDWLAALGVEGHPAPRMRAVRA